MISTLPYILEQHLPPSMLAALPLLPKNDQSVLLLTRHSIRELAPSGGFASYQLALTEVGRELASAWGEHLATESQRDLVACVSSPIPRCVDTATLMMSGYASVQPEHMQVNTQNIQVAEHALLVEPGSFVVDVNLAGPHFVKNGALKFINAFINEQLPGMKVPMQGVQDILRLLFDFMPKQGGQLSLAVSHDTILAAMLSLMAGHQKIEKSDWPLMMEGAFLWFEGDAFDACVVHWLWRGVHREFRPREIA